MQKKKSKQWTVYEKWHHLQDFQRQNVSLTDTFILLGKEIGYKILVIVRNSFSEHN